MWSGSTMSPLKNMRTSSYQYQVNSCNEPLKFLPVFLLILKVLYFINNVPFSVLSVNCLIENLFLVWFFSGGNDGPSGVLVCSENYLTYKNLGDQPDIRCPIPRRRVSFIYFFLLCKYAKVRVKDSPGVIISNWFSFSFQD